MKWTKLVFLIPTILLIGLIIGIVFYSEIVKSYEKGYTEAKEEPSCKIVSLDMQEKKEFVDKFYWKGFGENYKLNLSEVSTSIVLCPSMNDIVFFTGGKVLNDSYENFILWLERPASLTGGDSK